MMNENPIDLLSLILTLRSLEQPAGPALSWWGKAAHALLFRTLQQYDPEKTAAMHAEKTARPFTASSLLGRFPNHSLDLSADYELCFTALNKEISGILLEAVRPGGPLAPGAAVELDQVHFQVKAAAWGAGEHPRACTANYQELAAAALLAAEPAPRRVALQFESPTFFQSNGRTVPLPVPEMVFGSLLERWNAFSPVAFPAEARRYAGECLRLGRYSISSRMVQVAGGLQNGMVGEVTFVSENYDRYWMSLIHTLARYARYSGVGAKTAMGLGRCRVVDEREG